MESKGLTSIKEQLGKEQGELESKAEKLRSELHAVEGDLARIVSALAALNGSEAVGGQKKSSKQAKSGKPAASKADVVREIEAILRDDEVVEEAVLKSRVEESLTGKGVSRLGFALRFKEAIAESRFIDTPGGIRLQIKESVPK